MSIVKPLRVLMLSDVYFPRVNGVLTSIQTFRATLAEHGIKISMDGKGRWLDNVFVERLWRSVKYELVYLHAYESVTEARQQLAGYFKFFNGQRPHSSLGARTPDAAYFDSRAIKLAA